MTAPDPAAAWQRRIDTIDRLLPRLSGDAADRLQMERRALVRRVYDIPQAVTLPLDWSPALADLADIARQKGAIDADGPDHDADPWG